MKRLRVVYLLALVVVAVVAALFLPLLESFREQSPDGAFTVLARTQPYRSFIGVMPGQGSDKPARVTLYRGTQSCDSASAEMVSMARETRWEMDGKPRRLHIKFVADWNLDDCTVIRRWKD